MKLMTQKQQMEADANHFAMALLMPAHILRQDFPKFCPDGVDLVDDSGVVALANRYNVSFQLMMLRLVQLELVNP